ncbi:hypothetical protein KIW84_074184 [Lathyrus oleraceus]|uniref:Uncharacterized protein n=1 Tax=Pisum sativum TaxID=3888 RepID=A0A9D4VRM3_PEA|nr:hypothetical protein KIW84_074184 [Pisum sativum]
MAATPITLQAGSTTAAGGSSCLPSTTTTVDTNSDIEPGNFSGFSARPPHVNISSPNLQAGGEICAPPLHPPPYRPSTSVPASNSVTINEPISRNAELV